MAKRLFKVLIQALVVFFLATLFSFIIVGLAYINVLYPFILLFVATLVSYGFIEFKG